MLVCWRRGCLCGADPAPLLRLAPCFPATLCNAPAAQFSLLKLVYTLRPTLPPPLQSCVPPPQASAPFYCFLSSLVLARVVTSAQQLAMEVRAVTNLGTWSFFVQWAL